MRQNSRPVLDLFRLAAALLVGFLARLIGRRLPGAGPRLFGGTD